MKQVIIPQISNKPVFTRMLNNFNFSHEIIVTLTILIIAYFIQQFVLKLFSSKIVLKENVRKIYNIYLYLSLFIVFFVSVKIIIYVFIFYLIFSSSFVILFYYWEKNKPTIIKEKILKNKEKEIQQKQNILKFSNQDNNQDNKISQKIKIELNKIQLEKEWLTQKDLVELENIKESWLNISNIRDIKTKKIKFKLEKTTITIITLILLLLSVTGLILFFTYK